MKNTPLPQDAAEETEGGLPAVPCSPFLVPPFDPGIYAPKTKYTWWSWHPNYPYWSKSCWDGDTPEEAREWLEKDIAASMHYYHNKLIREGDGALVEVEDRPCQRLDIWEKIRRKRESEANAELSGDDGSATQPQNKTNNGH